MKWDVILKTTTELNAKNKLSFLAIVSPESYVRDIDNVYAETKFGYRSLFNLIINKNQKLAAGVEIELLQLSNERILKSNDTNFVYRPVDLINPILKYQLKNW
jgi:hypothetical protein